MGLSMRRNRRGKTRFTHGADVSVLVTGGAGFIGSSFIRYLFESAEFAGCVINLDSLTYAGNPANLADIAETRPDRYRLVQADIRDNQALGALFDERRFDAVVHFAAESHVDRSIAGPADFITTNILGTFNLLEQARRAAEKGSPVHFHHVSTDEVFGSLGAEGFFTETTPYDPRSPYSASKASSDHLVRAYHHTYGLPVTITNCSNNYGPRQFPEKLIPVIIEKALAGEPLPVYGDGLNVRDWLHVEDHSAAVWAVLTRGEIGAVYAVGGHNEFTNIDLVRLICDILAQQTGREPEEYRRLITYIKDRPGHDRRYAVDASKIEAELGWRPSRTLEEGMRRTVRWYLDNRDWVDRVKSGEYRSWMERNYDKR